MALKELNSYIKANAIKAAYKRHLYDAVKLIEEVYNNNLTGIDEGTFYAYSDVENEYKLLFKDYDIKMPPLRGFECYMLDKYMYY